MNQQTAKASDGRPRCQWCTASDDYIAYHDHEWGFPVGDDQRLFEKLTLESFQSGLSWRTILSKRDHFRAAFDQFDFHRIANYDSTDVNRLLADAGIVRHRGKIEATLNNAKRALELIDDFGSLATYFWSYEPETPLNAPQTQSSDATSTALSKDLKKRGWKFVGPTTIYSFIQAMGLINDHATDCYVREKVAAARKAFKRP